MILHGIAEHLLVRHLLSFEKLTELELPVSSRIVFARQFVTKLRLDKLWFSALCYTDNAIKFSLVINNLKVLYLLKDRTEKTMNELFDDELSTNPFKKAEDREFFEKATQKQLEKCRAILDYPNKRNQGGVARKVRQVQNCLLDDIRSVINKCYKTYRYVYIISVYMSTVEK
eukprot:sb/3479766/